MANYDFGGYEGLTPEAYKQLKQVYTALDKFVKIVGLEYTGDDYICQNAGEDWCHYEMLESLENAHADLEWFFNNN